MCHVNFAPDLHSHFNPCFFPHLLQLFDVVDTTDTKTLNHFLQMMSQEMQYLLAVLTQSTDRTIDLTPALRSAIDIIPEITYRFMKLQLSSGQIT